MIPYVVRWGEEGFLEKLGIACQKEWEQCMLLKLMKWRKINANEGFTKEIWPDVLWLPIKTIQKGGKINGSTVWNLNHHIAFNDRINSTRLAVTH